MANEGWDWRQMDAAGTCYRCEIRTAALPDYCVGTKKFRKLCKQEECQNSGICIHKSRCARCKQERAAFCRHHRMNHPLPRHQRIGGAF